jgi:hypothetical protein
VVIASLCGLALDAHVATRTRDLAELASANRWIAGNLLSIRGRHVEVHGAIPYACYLEVRVGRLTGFLAAAAAVPSLIDARTLPVRWRVTLRAFGMPLLEDRIERALDAGISVLAYSRWSATNLIVAGGDDVYRVQIDIHRLFA